MAIIMIVEIKITLKDIAMLLRKNGGDDIANNLDKLLKVADYNTDDFVRGAKMLLGGMGSLNDIVLSKEGVPLIEDNNKLEALRRDLYNICSSYKSGS
ncbi:hypothetical protein LQK91_06695 [Pantoea sp. MHSD4]|jgi:hypothetical protein|uniref:DUF6966 domain-containing protein n=2 Tax=Erwiniaceae TaxID=1903409 RepID=UPI000CF5529A|nr:hypothetical protein [Pantoea sp. MHSD4]MCD2356111.1 hypothetical protein [Pantoea sp. MHSD4]PQL30319.1 hypothetical protein C5L22_06725 [Pantoea ananatis]QXG53253.1 hypothetical protein KTJ90_11400 [Pantoea jilinensis]